MLSHAIAAEDRPELELLLVSGLAAKYTDFTTMNPGLAPNTVLS